MKYQLCQIDPIVGDIDGNFAIILKEIAQAKKNACDVIVFPELAICGYPPDDLLDYPYFIDKCIEAANKIALEAIEIAIVIGGVSKNTESKGRKLYNSAFVMQNGKIDAVIHKTLLPTYDIFSEARYFEPNKEFKLVGIKGKKVAISICEDLWDRHNDFEYEMSPVDELAKLKPDMHINICASPYHQTKYKERKAVIEDCQERMQCPLIYLNQAAAHTGILFDGDSSVYDNCGNKIIEFPLFKTYALQYDDSKNYQTIENNDIQKDHNIEVIHKALVFGIKSYFEKMGFAKIATLGSSGGIDSAVIQALASEAIGAANVLAVLMPSEFSSDGSITDAEQLSKNLGNPYEILPIKQIFNENVKTLAPIFKDLPFSVAEENIQARARGVLLMAISNKTGRFLLNTSNKSEMAVGYTTLYGDMCGGLCPIGDVYKTQVFELAKYINRDKEIIPNNIINKPPSAELRPNQKDSDSLPDYAELDAILKQYIEGKKDKKYIVNLGFEQKTVERVVDLVNRNEYKRWQAAPILKITTKDFSYGRKMPLVAKYD